MIEKQIVTPWDTKCGNKGFNYDRLIIKFGCSSITDELLIRFEKVTGHKPHLWMRRKIFFAHRQLNKILDDHEIGKPIFLYTGRGPTSDMHIGHALSFTLTKWLQEVFNAVVIIQIADDEKYYFKNMKFKDIYSMGFKNAEDIIAFGFDPDKTFIFSNRDYLTNKEYSYIISEIYKKIKICTIQSIFGIEKNNCIGQLVWPVYQTAAAFSKSFKHIFGKNNVRCLVLYAIDQDPYFRLARDIAPKMGFYKPCSMIVKFLPALDGASKLSSTGTNKVIYLTDTEKIIRKKIMKYTFSGGQTKLDDHRKLGGDTSKDISYQWLTFFEEDDNKLKQIKDDFESGKLLCSEIKNIMANKVIQFIQKIKKKKEMIKLTDIKKFYQ